MCLRVIGQLLEQTPVQELVLQHQLQVPIGNPGNFFSKLLHFLISDEKFCLFHRDGFVTMTPTLVTKVKFIYIFNEIFALL
jgi:hypothetical protein